MKQKKQPMRSCVGCNTLKLKKELVRVALAPSGEISIDTTGKAPGRGAYMCPNLSCLDHAYKAKRLERSLKHAVSKDIYEALRENIEHEQ